MMQRTFSLSLVLIALLLQVAPAAGQCKEFLGDRAPLEYRSRGSVPSEKRCEGFMKKDIAALDGEVVSITRGRPSYYSMANEVITITAPKVSGTSLLECVGVARSGGAYYRLDLELAPGETRRIPVKDVLLAGKVKNDQLGVILRKADGSDTYIPVTVSSQLRKGEVGAPDSVFIKFLPRILLRDMAVEVYDPDVKSKVFSGMVQGRFQADKEIQVGIPLNVLGIVPGQERVLLVMLKSKAEDGGPKLDRTFNVVFQ